MPVLFIPIAIPGAGKSAMAEVSGADAIVSTDQLRLELTGDMNSQDANAEVFRRYYQNIDLFLRGSKDVWADATNLEAFSRLKLRSIADRITDEANDLQDLTRGHILWPVRTHAIIFRNLDQAIARNYARDRVVPKDVMERMIEKYERALMDIVHEDYDFVTEVSATR